MKEDSMDKATRIYQTIKRNKSILKDPRIILPERKKEQIERDNLMLLSELKQLVKEA